MANQDINRRFNLISGNMSAVDGVAELEKRARRAESALESTAKAGRGLSTALADVERKAKIDNLAKAAARYTSETGNARTAQLRLNAELEKTNANQAEINRAAQTYHSELESIARLSQQVGKYGGQFGREQLGDISTSLSSLGSVAGSFGGNAANELLYLGGDTFGVLEYMGRFKQSLKEAGEAILKSDGLLGDLSTKLLATFPGLSGASAGLASMALAAAPFVAAGAALVGAVVLVTSAYEEQKRIATEAAQAYLEGLDAETKARFLAQRGRFDELKQLQATEEETAALAAANFVALNEELAYLTSKSTKEIREETGLTTAEIRARYNEVKTALAEQNVTTGQAIERYEGVKRVTEEYSDQIHSTGERRNLAKLTTA